MVKTNYSFILLQNWFKYSHSILDFLWQKINQKCLKLAKSLEYDGSTLSVTFLKEKCKKTPSLTWSGRVQIIIGY